MSFLIVMVVIFILVSIFNSGKRIESTNEHRKRTITNVKLQDELWCEAFKTIMKELEEIESKTPIACEDLMETIESFFKIYDLPDSRTAAERQAAASKYISGIRRHQRELPKHLAFPADTASVPLAFKIYRGWYPFYTTVPPLLEKPELHFGEPYTSITIDDDTIEYDFAGRAKVYQEPYLLICMIANLLTKKELYKQGYNYSWDRQESLWQQSEQKLKKYEERKKKYPWL